MNETEDQNLNLMKLLAEANDRNWPDDFAVRCVKNAIGQDIMASVFTGMGWRNSDTREDPYVCLPIITLDPEAEHVSPEEPPSDEDLANLILWEHMGRQPGGVHRLAATTAMIRTDPERWLDAIYGGGDEDPDLYKKNPKAKAARLEYDRTRNMLAEEIRCRCGEIGREAQTRPFEPATLENLNEAFLKTLSKLGYSELETVKADIERGCYLDYWASPFKPEEANQIAFPVIDEYQQDPGIQYAVSFARIVGQAILEAQSKSQGRTPAVVRTTIIDQFRSLQEDKQLQIPDLDDGLVYDKSGRKVVATIESIHGVTISRIRDSLDLRVMGGVAAHRLFNLFVINAFDRKALGEDQYDTSYFEGGWSGVCHAIEMGKKHVDKVRRVIEVGASIKWEVEALGRKGGGWWTYSEPTTRGGGGRKSIIEVKLANALCPNYVNDLHAMTPPNRRTQKFAEATRLIPELRNKIPLTKRPADWGGTYMLQRLFVIKLVDRSIEMVNKGMVRITPKEWERLAKEAGYPKQAVPSLLELWEEGNQDAPALLKRDGEYYNLSDTYREERDFIRDGGQIRLSAQRAGRKGAANRSKARRN